MVRSPLYKLTVINFPLYLVKTISSNLHCRTFQMSFKSVTSSRISMPLVWLRADSSVCCTIQSMCESYGYALPPCRVSNVDRQHGSHSHVPQYFFPVGYQETYLDRFAHWLRDWRINTVSRSTAVLSTKTTSGVQRSRPVQFYRESFQCVETWWKADLVGSRQTGRKKGVQRLVVLGPILNRSGLSIRNCVLLDK
jgi:hypothetical protein